MSRSSERLSGTNLERVSLTLGDGNLLKDSRALGSEERGAGSGLEGGLLAPPDGEVYTCLDAEARSGLLVVGGAALDVAALGVLFLRRGNGMSRAMRRRVSVTGTRRRCAEVTSFAEAEIDGLEALVRVATLFEAAIQCYITRLFIFVDLLDLGVQGTVHPNGGHAAVRRADADVDQGWLFAGRFQAQILGVEADQLVVEQGVLGQLTFVVLVLFTLDGGLVLWVITLDGLFAVLRLYAGLEGVELLIA